MLILHLFFFYLLYTFFQHWQIFWHSSSNLFNRSSYFFSDIIMH